MRVPAIRSLHQSTALTQPLPLPRGWLILCAAVVSWLALASFVASVMALFALGGVS